VQQNIIEENLELEKFFPGKQRNAIVKVGWAGGRG